MQMPRIPRTAKSMRKILIIVAVVVLVAVIAIGVGQWRSDEPLPGAGQEPPTAPTDVTNPPGCVDVQVIAAPGTWESAADDDPIHPTANPHSLLLSITQPLQEMYPEDEVSVWTLPYTAQFRNINAQHEMTYDESQAEGRARIDDEIRRMNEACPATDFVLIGFSQGAVIVGDLASDIGQGRGPVASERISGVALIADGRREPGVGMTPSVSVGGVGLELPLAGLNGAVQLITPGATMRGGREGGFGDLNDKVQQICAPTDAVCDAPAQVGDALGRAMDYVGGNEVHAQYATNPDVFPGTTTPEWVIGWSSGLIDQAMEKNQ